MAKVSIELRGWRFEESDVFTPDGEIRPLEEMPPDTRERVLRLSALVGSPCDACWLIHGDEDIEQCNVAEVVYGEPLAEVVLCRDHEPDFLYWFREVGGSEHRGSEDLEDAFHAWFADGGRAPEGYGGLEHVETDPTALPEDEDLIPDSSPGCQVDPDADEGGAELEDDLDLGADYPGG